MNIPNTNTENRFTTQRPYFIKYGASASYCQKQIVIYVAIIIAKNAIPPFVYYFVNSRGKQVVNNYGIYVPM